MTRLATAVLFIHATAAFAGPHLAFTRVVPAPQDLAPAQHLAVIYAIGDNLHVTTFVNNFVEYVDRAGTLRIDNSVMPAVNTEGYSAALAFRATTSTFRRRALV